MSAIHRVLIANRGEIACRVIATCQRMEIHTVAVYSQSDRGARHVRMADQAVCIGPAAASASYLNAERIIEAAVATQADAIHPGYGFLAENAAFAQAVIDAGLIFIGPTPETIQNMGSKAQAKALMAAAGVPLVPGFHGEDASDSALIDQAGAVGWPLMVKAAAGGGGKGMRIVEDAPALAEGLKAARREAKAAFGDDRLILERCLQRPRHIEAQILGDAHGRVVHSYERDCSSQRRHQKVIEEAPAPNLPAPLRDGLLEAAVKAAQAVGYVGAGTVEFLVDESGEAFYFLEMNPRLQVEHPVTAKVTGLDLVEWQLRIAQGESLPAQDAIPAPNGHAFEARIYAEDPEQGFLPATGTLQSLHWPEQVRVDTGVDAGDQIGIDYDPMIAKVIVHGPDRAHALAALQRALAECFIDGVVTNLGFLTALAHDRPLLNATMDTGYLDRGLASLLSSSATNHHQAIVLAGALWAKQNEHLTQQRLGDNPWARASGWRLGMPASGQTWLVQSTDAPTAVRVFDHASEVQLADDERRYAFTWHRFDEQTHQDHTQIHAQLTFNEHTQDAHTIEAIAHLHPRGHIEWVSEGRRQCFSVQQQWLDVDDGAPATGLVTAPMPGQVTAVHVDVGQTVQPDEVLALMEAMKMELSIRASIAGTIEAVFVSPGDRIDADSSLMEIVPNPDS